MKREQENTDTLDSELQDLIYKISDEAGKRMHYLEGVIESAADISSITIPDKYRGLTLRECTRLMDFYQKCFDIEDRKDVLRVINHPYAPETEYHSRLDTLLRKFLEISTK